MKMKNKFLATIFGAALVLGACGGGGDDKAGDKESAAGGVDADKVFQANCATCHGGNLEGMNGPALANIGGELSKPKSTTSSKTVNQAECLEDLLKVKS